MLAMGIGITIGLVLGLTGAGGSLLAVPLLVVVLGFSAQNAVGIALGAVAASAAAGVISRISSGDIAWRHSAWFALTGTISTPVGRLLGSRVDDTLMLSSFSILALVIALQMWFHTQDVNDKTIEVRAFSVAISEREAPSKTERKQFAIKLCASGIVAGVLSGFFGVGGGFFIVPILTGICGLSLRMAVGTSLVIIASNSAAGFIAYLATGALLPLPLLSTIISGGLLGIWLGTRTARHLPLEHLQKVLALGIAISVVAMIAKISAQ